jgi:hypothetical protein
MHDDFRLPTATEFATLKKLLAEEFSGREKLSEQLDGLLVKTIDKEGSLSLRVTPIAVPADVEGRVPVEGYYS